jgi:redox-sensitive bicupin YhaK (pirin superfamily)
MGRKVAKIKRNLSKHWLGDGFLVSNMFSHDCDHNISPFLLLDYVGPTDFSPTDNPRGIKLHPHRGFEIVTIVYEGEVEHRDTAGHFSKIGPGDVQWMTAARGILHEEMHSREFTQKGGKLEMVQLWVNLPAKHKMSIPQYQEIMKSNILMVEDKGVAVRVIAGRFGHANGVARTFTPMHLYDIQVHAGASLSIPVEDKFNASLLVLKGNIQTDGETLTNGEIAIFTPNGDTISLKSATDAKILFLAGEPINEPVVAAGPLIMNTEAEIQQAFADFRIGVQK